MGRVGAAEVMLQRPQALVTAGSGLEDPSCPGFGLKVSYRRQPRLAYKL